MLSNKKFLTLITVCGTLASCSVDEIKVPEEELFAREFIKSYGLIDPSQDWSVAKKETVTVSVSGETSVRITARHDGKMILLGDFKNVNGTQELSFDCPKQVQEVIVSTSGYMQKVPVGGSLTVGSTASRAVSDSDPFANFGNDELPGLVENNGIYWSSEYVDPIIKVLPEGDNRNINVNGNDMVADFSFVSDGKPFTIYPIYWQTGSHDVLGVYWYENGVMKTKDIFDNNLVADNGKFQNIYHRNQGLTVNTSIADQQKEVAKSGTIELTFSRKVKLTDKHAATLTDANGNTYNLEGPVFAAGNKVATYTYSGLPSNTAMKLTLAQGAFITDDVLIDAGSKQIESPAKVLNFTTVDDTPKWQKTDFTFIPETQSCAIVISFDRPISLGTGDARLESGAISAVPGTPSISGNDLKLTYTGVKFNTTYTLTIPDGFVVDATTGTPASMEGYTARNTFTTPEKELTYETTATKVAFKLDDATDIDGKGVLSSTKYPSGTNIAEDGAPLKAYFCYQENGKPTFSIGISELDFGTLSGDELTKVSFDYGIRSKTTKPSATTTGIDEAVKLITDAKFSLIIIEPDEDMILTAYTFSQNSDINSLKDRFAQFWDIEAKKEVPYLTDVVSTTGNDKTINSTSYRPCSRAFKLSKGKQYMIYCAGGEYRIAGFAYQLANGEAEQQTYTTTRTAPKRGGSRALSDIDQDRFGANGQVPDIYPDRLEENGFERQIASRKEAVNQGDEVITHEISFTLPKGVIFGFYLHNHNGAAQITGPGDKPKDYANFSMSSLNQTQPQSFFNRLDTSKPEHAYFTNGWGTKVDNPQSGKGNYHDELKNGNKYVSVPETRRYSTASTYTYEGMRYFSFEDWVDYDFNDIAFMVAPRNADVEVIEGEVETNPYIFAVEDLGATTKTDIDFNDVVFAVEHVAGFDKAYVTMLAAGGTLRAELWYNGVKIDGQSGGQKIVGGPYAGTGTLLDHVNNWFGENNISKVINVGAGNYKGFGNLTTVEITVPDGFEISDNLTTDFNDHGFMVKVYRDGETEPTNTITRPDATGLAPQVLILPKTWHWPLEGIAISEAYAGGINYDGTYLPSFQNWVNGGDDGQNGFKLLNWHNAPTDGKVMDHLWSGSEAARATFGTK